MQLLRTAFHPDVSAQDISSSSGLKLKERRAARAIVINREEILLLYTQYYHDYSLPGGGIDEGEDEIAGLVRELQEETGASGVRNIKPFARYEEYRPWYKSDADIIHMISYCYMCDIDEKLGEPTLESYEIRNGMKPVWINIHEAIAHNQAVIDESDRKGLSIERETYLLNTISQRLIKN